MKVLIFPLFFACAYAIDLKCYDCDPSGPGRCVTPHKDNVKETICADPSGTLSGLKKQISDVDTLDIEPRMGENQTEFECFSLYYATDSNETSGVYRGCTEKSMDLRSSCEYLTERLENGNVTLCQTCSDNVCNIHDVGSAPASITLSVGIFAVNLLVCLRMLNF